MGWSIWWDYWISQGRNCSYYEEVPKETVFGSEEVDQLDGVRYSMLMSWIVCGFVDTSHIPTIIPACHNINRSYQNQCWQLLVAKLALSYRAYAGIHRVASKLPDYHVGTRAWYSWLTRLFFCAYHKLGDADGLCACGKVRAAQHWVCMVWRSDINLVCDNFSPFPSGLRKVFGICNVSPH